MSKIIGTVELYRPEDLMPFLVGHNLVTYEGYDALGKILAGELAGGINCVYFQFNNDGAGVARTAALTDTAADYLSLNGTVDFLRVKMRGGTTGSSGANFTTNKASFDCIATVGLTGVVSDLAFSDSSYVEKLGLVVAPDWDDHTKDMLYASFAPGSPQDVSASGIAMRWQTQFSN